MRVENVSFSNTIPPLAENHPILFLLLHRPDVSRHLKFYCVEVIWCQVGETLNCGRHKTRKRNHLVSSTGYISFYLRPLNSLSSPHPSCLTSSFARCRTRRCSAGLIIFGLNLSASRRLERYCCLYREE